MIITIDGPAGAGKSTIARALAQRLGFAFLDTGAMYRAVALAGLRAAVSFEHPDALAAMAQRIEIVAVGPTVMLDGEDVGLAIRTPEVTAATRYAADNLDVRRRLVTLQRAAGDKVDLVTEGRDQGTLVFPNAACKIFLTASPRERARRRLADLLAQGETVTLAEVLAAQAKRDREDASREVGALIAADDAIEVVTDGLDRDAVVARLEALARKVLRQMEATR